jgi:hypothetical protein
MSSSEICVINHENTPEGISSEMFERLRERGFKYRTGKEKWDQIYNILFPEAPVPSPC